LKATNPAVNIELLGVNDQTQSGNNALATLGRTLPWLQDTAADSVWTLWGVTYRDVRILDGRNRLHAVYNLTSQDLAIAQNRANLKALLLQAAAFVDTDGDQLSDDWETLNLGNLAASARDDSDFDGQDNFTEYAFGTSPTNALSKAAFQTTLTGSGTNRSFAITFRRRAGSGIDYVIDASSSILPWTPSNTESAGPFQNFFDGTGTGRLTYSVPAPPEGNQFLRIRATPGVLP
jgi:hypothetical protein